MVAILVLCGCSKPPPPAQLTPDAARVQVGHGDPPPNYELIGGVTGQDGNGCGRMGRRGTYENAVTAVRVRAAALGADYVSITLVTEPHLRNEHCFANPYVIKGMAYRMSAAAPPSTPVQPEAAANPDDDIAASLQKLHELHQAGALTAEEYSRAKARLLAD